MPSDPREAAALAALAADIKAYRYAVAAAVERVEHFLMMSADEGPQRLESELGDFARDRVDGERFASILSGAPVLDDFERALVRRAHEVLLECHRLPDRNLVVTVPTGGRLGGAIGNTLADFGRAFAAALVVELVRSRRYDVDEHEGLLHGFPQRRWNRAERSAAPPLVVNVEGADLWAGEIAPYVDGRQKIVLIVRGPCPPAPLVRLITPGVLVLQTARVDALDAIHKAEGPAVAALVPEGAAEFLHLPATNAAIHERLTVAFTPPASKRSIEAWSAWQQHEELQQLVSLATPSARSIAGEVPEYATADPVDRLAGWLLEQASADAASTGAKA